MDSALHALPPLKRMRLRRELELARAGDPDAAAAAAVSSTHLPAKKRKESRFACSGAASEATYCLPAKKRVWALHPQFDLNLEYKHSLHPEVQETQAVSKETEDKMIEEEEEEGSGEQCLGDGEEEEGDDGIECAICGSTDGCQSDPIVFCDGCDLMVHASCFGNPLRQGVPEGDWFCPRCLELKVTQNVPPPLFCCLCPSPGGALKPTSDGRWAHVVCALFVPEVFFLEPEGRDGIDCSRVPARRWDGLCYLCDSATGCVVDCSESKCRLAFHVTCGLKEELCIEYREGKKNGAIVVGFCKSHTELWKKEQGTGKFRIVAREEHQT